MASDFPLVPIAVSVGIAGVDGVLSSGDINSGRTEYVKQHAAWFQLGVLALGLGMELTGMGRKRPYLTEPMMFVPAALASRAMAFRFAQGSGSTNVSQPYRAMVAGNVGAVQAPAMVARPYMAQQSGGIL